VPVTLQLIPVPGVGPEDVVVSTAGTERGTAYTATEDGSVWRLRADGQQVDRLARTGGRPLGVELDGDGRLIVCDAYRGLLRVDPRDGRLEVLVDAVDGVPMRCCDNAAVADDGSIWFSDSSTKFWLDRWMHDVVQNTRTGRLLRRTPDGEVEVVLDGLSFANGVALSRDQDFVVVAESGTRTVVRRWLTGTRAGMRDYLCQDLPGYPDNVSLGSDGLLWVALPRRTDPLLAPLQSAPKVVRRLASPIAARMPARRPVSRVRAYDDQGRLVHDLEIRPDQPGGGLRMVTTAREQDGRVWLGSLYASAIGVQRL
jgi:sugar lactone lactonase YvrE